MHALLYLFMAMSSFLIMAGLIWLITSVQFEPLVSWPIESVIQRLRIWILARQVRGLKVGLSLYTGGTEDNPVNHETRRAYVNIIRRLRNAGVIVAPLHAQAASSLRHGDIWRDRLVEYDNGMLDAVIVGDWRCWHPMNYPGPEHHSLNLQAYANNGAQIPLGSHQIETPIYGFRGGRQRVARLERQGLQRILRALDLVRRRSFPDPGFYYDTSTWPYDQQVAR